MSKAKRVYTKSHRADQPGTMIGVRLQPSELELLDLWIANNTPISSRPEAMRRILKLVAIRLPE